MIGILSSHLFCTPFITTIPIVRVIQTKQPIKMNPKIISRLSKKTPDGRLFLGSSERSFAKTSESVQDEAALLLSISHIAESEIKSSGFKNAWNEGRRFPVPTLPLFSSNVGEKTILPLRFRSSHDDTGKELTRTPTLIFNRIRSVSMDEHCTVPTTSPLSLLRGCTPSPSNVEADTSEYMPIVSPTQAGRPRVNRNVRSSSRTKEEKCKKDQGSTTSLVDFVASPLKSTSGALPLQGASPEDVPITQIHRRKFSWKSYPEVC